VEVNYEKCINHHRCSRSLIGSRREEKSYEETLAYINETAELFRNAGKPVIVVRNIEEGDGDAFLIVKEALALQCFNMVFLRTILKV